ncbi:hypothetical protein, partial [Vibrio parahaemolyticus]|uniref:hypothetical protein n=1 Tax=Vibrio parahaemolyticus TaxID=670 RepID=UPI001C5EDD3A
ILFFVSVWWLIWYFVCISQKLRKVSVVLWRWLMKALGWCKNFLSDEKIWQGSMIGGAWSG